MSAAFDEWVAALCDAIPDGKVATYGLIAALCVVPATPAMWDGRWDRACRGRPTRSSAAAAS